MHTMPPSSEMERAYRRRDASYNGLFFFGVRTTGIFCRPTCPARKPLPENVDYFPTARAALAAGYRPCKRCRPLAVDDQPEWVSALLSDIDVAPSTRITEETLRAKGIDPTTARRYFLRHFGMTFHAFARATRLTSALNRMREGGTLDNSVFASGFDSHSGFREAFVRTFGGPPGHYRDRDHVVLSWLRSPLGPLLAGANAQGVCLVEFTDRRMIAAQLATAGRLFGARVTAGSNEHLEQLRAELAGYFVGSVQRFSVPVVYPGSPFQRQVWEELLRIPYGETRSYEELAIAIRTPTATRAVGRANGLNRLSILIPCHRVVRKDGTLGGYGGGLWRKQYLLDLERSHRQGPA
jgi:AraC family transcriptional regulator, regulatory protein of adaptative response / methylated-DNA-[protein]-cysteine methyltransferase